MEFYYGMSHETYRPNKVGWFSDDSDDTICLRCYGSEDVPFNTPHDVIKKKAYIMLNKHCDPYHNILHDRDEEITFLKRLRRKCNKENGDKEITFEISDITFKNKTERYVCRSSHMNNWWFSKKEEDSFEFIGFEKKENDSYTRIFVIPIYDLENDKAYYRIKVFAKPSYVYDKERNEDRSGKVTDKIAHEIWERNTLVEKSKVRCQMENYNKRYQQMNKDDITDEIYTYNYHIKWIHDLDELRYLLRHVVDYDLELVWLRSIHKNVTFDAENSYYLMIEPCKDIQHVKDYHARKWIGLGDLRTGDINFIQNRFGVAIYFDKDGTSFGYSSDLINDVRKMEMIMKYNLGIKKRVKE